ncbi:DUF3530 family protein [Halopseudomonas sp.]|uniref:DUF3530 family protein n=1 Tax=Halopseudomonas sp. TaxID=2901191 RepID=UPI003566330E
MLRPILLLSICLALAAQASGIHAQEAGDPAEPAGQAEPEAQEEAAPAASLPRAERQEQALHKQLPGAQLRQLESGDDHFLGLFLAAAQPEPRGGVLLIADRNEHADWPELIAPARRQLSDLGWHTLAITLPDAPLADPTLEGSDRIEMMAEAAERTIRRINIAAQALQAEGAKSLVLLGRGEGAFWALHATAASARPQIEAAALILAHSRPPALAEGGWEKIDELLAQWQNPAYEIFAGSGAVTHKRARQHELSARRNANGQYQQLLLPKQDRSELGQRMLVKRLQGWLDKKLPAQP